MPLGFQENVEISGARLECAPSSGQEADQEQDQENDKADLRNASRCGSDTAESENGGYDRDH